ncbi:MAG: CarD family transcriptional regulator [Pseudomonadota bacterium]
MASSTSDSAALDPAALAPGLTVVHGTHGIGTVTGLDTLDIGGATVDVVVVVFSSSGMNSGMTLRVPKPKLKDSGLRGLASRATIDEALALLSTPSKVRHADQYRLVAECNERLATGDLLKTARVARDMFRAATVRETPFSVERTFEDAVRRIADEGALVLDTTPDALEAMIRERLTDDRPA